MSFWKKLLATENLSEEEIAQRETEKAEKKRKREEQNKAYQEQIEKEKAAKRAEKERKRQEELIQVKKYFGPNPSVRDELNYSYYKKTINYLEDNVLDSEEKVLISIPAEYDKTKTREIKGLLIATSERLLFITYGLGHGEFTETLQYNSIKGISLAPDGFSKKELLIDYGRSRRIFDDIKSDEKFNHFIETVRKKMHEPKPTQINKKKTPPKNADKYSQLEQLGKLLENGILTEEEFEKEKEKILNS
jgi:hypothetical protein